MAVNLRGRSFLTLMDFTPEEIRYLIDLAKELKSKKIAGIQNELLKGKTVCLLFEKTSTRTRCAFEVACHEEGANVTYLDSRSSQMGKKESLEDTAKVLGRFYDGIEYRGFDQNVVVQLAKYSGVPVFNGLTDIDHPTQILADMMTIEEHCHKPLNKIKVVFPGDVRNNMCYAWMYGCAKMGMHFAACAPEKYWPNAELRAECEAFAKISGGTITFEEDPIKGTKGADVICTDVWVSMGESPDVWEKRIKDLSPYRVTAELMDAAGKDCVFMHCLPAFHDLGTGIGKEIHEKFGIDCMEVTDEVFESDRSIVFSEAENRMHTIKAVMLATLKEEL